MGADWWKARKKTRVSITLYIIITFPRGLREFKFLKVKKQNSCFPIKI